MGRNKKYESGELSEIVRFKLLPEQRDLLFEIAEDTGGTVSGIIRNMIEKQLIKPYVYKKQEELKKADAK